MAKSTPTRSGKNADLPPVPVLTEVVGVDTGAIPVLTEILTEPSHPLSDEQCQEVAEQIAPQLETLLREKLAQHLDQLMQEVMHDARSSLPAMIRSALDRNPPISAPQSAKIAPSADTQILDQAKHNNDGTRKKL